MHLEQYVLFISIGFININTGLNYLKFCSSGKNEILMGSAT